METALAPALTLVLADDHGIVREGIAAFCKSRPEITILGQCSDGEQALAMILESKPDFAILDLNMPKLSGLDVVRRVRTARCPTKIIVLSINRDEAIIRELFRAGANGYVLKDGPARHLFDAINFIADGGQYLTPLLRRDPLEDVAERGSSGGKTEKADPISLLSKREYEVFSFLVDGMRPKDIAKLLDISPKTVDTYRANIMRKLEVDGIAGLVRFAIQRNVTSNTLPC
jgi:DNA-binding NarL/FixJ family response regulator